MRNNLKRILSIWLCAIIVTTGFLLIINMNATSDTIEVLSAKLPYPTWRSSAICNDNNIYIFGGDDKNSIFDRIVRFDISTNSVSIMSAKLPSPRHSTAAIWDGHYAFIFGGCVGPHGQPVETIDEIVRYDLSTDTVTVMSTKLPTPRGSISAVWDGTYAYIFGGTQTNGVDFDDIVRYNPGTDTIAIMSAKLPFKGHGTSAICSGNYAFIFGGGGLGGDSKDILKYDTYADTLTVLSTKLPTRRAHASAVWSGTNAYVFGGHYGDIDEIVKFNPNTEVVEVISSKLPTPRSHTSAVWVEDSAYIIGGFSNNLVIDEIVRYTPKPMIAVVDVKPESMNNVKQGKLTIFLEVPGYNISDINQESLQLLNSSTVPTKIIEDWDLNRLILKYWRSEAYQQNGWYTIEGSLHDGTKFRGADYESNPSDDD